ncbi:MAG: M50 family metallopeptidase [Clostridiales bacterium]|nr:M50 family metallopeptidase [Clostridiales bacterium]
MKKKEKSKFKLASILPYAIGAAIGLLFAFFSNGSNTKGAGGESSLALEFVPVLILLTSFFFGIALNVVLHELGHLICGLLSGYKFISFSVGHIMLVKENGKLKKKSFGVAGVGGQCLMSPPEPVNGAFPFLLYNLGGSCMNFIVSGIFVMLFMLLRDAVVYSESIFLPIAFVGALLGIINVLPIKIEGVSTDGHNIVSMRKSEISRRAFWVLLTMNARMALGARLKDLPESWFEITEGYDFNDTVSANVAAFRLNRLIERRDFAEAKALA